MRRPTTLSRRVRAGIGLTTVLAGVLTVGGTLLASAAPVTSASSSWSVGRQVAPASSSWSVGRQVAPDSSSWS